jgi:hypothetical protein
MSKSMLDLMNELPTEKRSGRIKRHIKSNDNRRLNHWLEEVEDNHRSEEVEEIDFSAVGRKSREEILPGPSGRFEAAKTRVVSEVASVSEWIPSNDNAIESAIVKSYRYHPSESPPPLALLPSIPLSSMVSSVERLGSVQMERERFDVPPLIAKSTVPTIQMRRFRSRETLVNRHTPIEPLPPLPRASTHTTRQKHSRKPTLESFISTSDSEQESGSTTLGSHGLKEVVEENEVHRLSTRSREDEELFYWYPASPSLYSRHSRIEEGNQCEVGGFEIREVGKKMPMIKLKPELVQLKNQSATESRRKGKVY